MLQAGEFTRAVALLQGSHRRPTLRRCILSFIWTKFTFAYLGAILLGHLHRNASHCNNHQRGPFGDSGMTRSFFDYLRCVCLERLGLEGAFCPSTGVMLIQPRVQQQHPA